MPSFIKGLLLQEIHIQGTHILSLLELYPFEKEDNDFQLWVYRDSLKKHAT